MHNQSKEGEKEERDQDITGMRNKMGCEPKYLSSCLEWKLTKCLSEETKVPSLA